MSRCSASLDRARRAEATPVTRPARARGFSLVEVLVVVVILAILVSLGVGWTQKVAIRADQARCAANLRTIGQAIFQFHNEHNRLPGPINEAQSSRALPPNPNGSHFVQALYPYLDLPDYTPAMSNTFVIPALLSPATKRLMPEARVSYIANRRDPWPMGNVNSPDTNSASLTAPKRLIALPQPSKTALVMNADRGQPNPITTSSMFPNVVTHGTVRNVLYADGHVEARPASQGRPPVPSAP